MLTSNTIVIERPCIQNCVRFHRSNIHRTLYTSLLIQIFITEINNNLKLNVYVFVLCTMIFCQQSPASIQQVPFPLST